MKLTPLVLHAGVILPRHTALFSDALPVSSIVITEGASIVLTTTAAHLVPVGSIIAVSITDADTPNPITAASVDGDGNIVLTTEHPHDMTTTPNADLYDAWSTLAKITGFTNALINGNRSVVSAPDRNTVVITPGGTVTSITLNGSEALLERLEQAIVGWHAVTATGAQTLAFDTPASITRSYTTANPVVVTNIRVFGALDYETAMGHYTADNSEAIPERPVMFILPVPVNAEGGKSYLTSGSDNRMVLRDGFTVLVLIPSHTTAAHVAAIDSAQGAIFRAVMRTFHGLKISRSEYVNAGDYLATFESHNGARGGKNRAIYAHEYVFDMPAEITSCDGVSPFDWSQIDDGALADGDVPTSIYPSDPPAFRDLDVSGILHYGHPSPMTGSFIIEPEDA